MTFWNPGRIDIEVSLLEIGVEFLLASQTMSTSGGISMLEISLERSTSEFFVVHGER